MLSDFIVLVFNALNWAMATFLVASGLTLVFGILHVLNFSHGGFFMIGAYLAYSLLAPFGMDVGIGHYLGAALLAAVAIGAIGWGVDRLIIRRLQNVDGTYILIATYALLLVCGGVVKVLWGLNYLSVSPPESLLGALFIGDALLPTFSIFLIGAGVFAYLVLEGALYHTRLGKMLEAIAMDPWVAKALGIDVSKVYSLTIVAGFALAGLAGGLLVANQSLSPELSHVFILQAFGVVIVGGMGSIRGAFIASLLLGALEIVSATFLPNYPGVLFFAAIAFTLLIRPQGLMGREVHA